eukprot:3189282-Amphidinium_carterae.1
MRRLSRVLTTPIRKKEGVSGCACRDLRRGSQFLRKLDSEAISLDTGRDFLQEIPNLGLLPLGRKSRA